MSLSNHLVTNFTFHFLLSNFQMDELFMLNQAAFGDETRSTIRASVRLFTGMTTFVNGQVIHAEVGLVTARPIALVSQILGVIVSFVRSVSGSGAKLFATIRANVFPSLLRVAVNVALCMIRQLTRKPKHPVADLALV